MNLALLKKSLLESRWLLLSSAALMLAIHWLLVWTSSFFSVEDMQGMLSYMPELVEELMPVSFSQFASAAGRIGLAYDHPIVLLLVTVWAISRGSDAVSGELNRGTLEMVIAQPVTRSGALWTQAAVTLAGAAALGAIALAGTSLGLATVKLEQSVSPRVSPAALNLASLCVFLAGLSTMVSSANNYRSRTIGIVGGFYALSMVAKVVGRVAPGWKWLTYVSFFTPFEPQQLINNNHAWSFWFERVNGTMALGGLGYDSILIGAGLACYVVATLIFAYRDLPAPL